MIKHGHLSEKETRKLIRNGKICWGGNIKLKIYGTLQCRSGKRMKKENRIFFVSENEALKNGYRPCAHCLPGRYYKWKNDGSIQH